MDVPFPLSMGPMHTHPGNYDHIDAGIATPARPQSPPGHPKSLAMKWEGWERQKQASWSSWRTAYVYTQPGTRGYRGV